MKLSISNIAWPAENDEEMYAFLEEQGLSGLEIAPTRIFPENPYNKIDEAIAFKNQIQERYRINICSMQSIWYGLHHNIFGTDEDREFLISYTKKAIDFAAAIGCENLVFGNPKNRNISNTDQIPVAIDFFRTIGEYAAKCNTIIAIEPNPPIYNTNFINTTKQAFEFCRDVNSPGFKVNLDLGTCIYYDDKIDFINENIKIINHIHISEPMLAPIEKRTIHQLLKKLDYQRYFSIEMANKNDLEVVKNSIRYIKGVLD
jgi:sugar phosphate isomerase/epimerase